MWCWQELNRRHMDFQSIALPPELQHQLLSPNGIAKVVIIFYPANLFCYIFKIFTAALRLRSAEDNTLRGHATLSLMYPVPSSPNIAPSFRARCA